MLGLVHYDSVVGLLFLGQTRRCQQSYDSPRTSPPYTIYTYKLLVMPPDGAHAKVQCVRQSMSLET